MIWLDKYADSSFPQEASMPLSYNLTPLPPFPEGKGGKRRTPLPFREGGGG